MLSWIVTVLLVALFTVLFGFLAIGPAAILVAVALVAILAWSRFGPKKSDRQR
jgi:hypothetical protein